MTAFFRLWVRSIAGIALAAATLGVVALGAAPIQAGMVPPAERQAELENLLVQDCGSCHGLTLAGGLGPGLRSQDLIGKPASLLAATILYGRPGTSMPPWRPFLTATEAQWLALLLKGQTP